MSLRIVCILYFFFKFYEILFENHILYEKVISIKIIIIIIIIIIRVQQTALHCTKLYQVAPICTKPDQVA